MGVDKGVLSGGCFNGQDIEPPRSIFQTACTSKLMSHAREVAAFFEIYGAFPSGLAWLNFGSRLNFDE